MSETRSKWSPDEKRLLRDLRGQNGKISIPDFTALFNEKNNRFRSEDAIRGQLKALRRLARENDLGSPSGNVIAPLNQVPDFESRSPY